LKKKIFITGSTGLLGSNWVEKLYKKNFVKSSSFKNESFINKKNNIKIKGITYVKFFQKLKEFSPDLIIHTAGITDVDECENNQKNAKKVNLNFTKKIVDYCKIYNTKLIYISSDHIFNDEKNYFSETDTVSPQNFYAKTKVLSEKYIIKNLKKYLVVRTNFFGLGNTFKQSFSERIINSIKLNKNIYLFENVYFNPVEINTLISAVETLINKKINGIFNISTNNKISKYEFGLKLAKLFNIDTKLIKKNKLNSKLNLVKRPLNMSLSNKKITKYVNIKNFDLDNNLATFKKVYLSNYYKFRPLIPYGRHLLKKIDIKKVSKILLNKNLTQGDEVLKFEEKFAKFVGSKYAIAVSSASAGLHLCFNSLKKNKNSKLITSPITFVSTTNSAIHNNAKIKFIDIDNNSLNINYKLISQLRGKSSSNIIMPIHFAGSPCEMKKIQSISNVTNDIIIEDAAHALGAKNFDGSFIGNCKYSDAAVFSFHPVKSITSGEGGMITTNNYNTYIKLLRTRSHGINKLNDQMLNKNNSKTDGLNNLWYYEMIENGFNYRLTDIQCALGNSQLDSLNEFIEKRKYLALRYDDFFYGCKNIKITQQKTRNISSHHLYVIRINYKKSKISRAELMHKLRQDGIITQVHYIPIPMHPFYKKKGYSMRGLSNTTKYYEEALSIPIFYNLNEQVQNFVAKKLKFYLE
jgi:dTDP-4-dehydrorhamnose reductase